MHHTSLCITGVEGGFRQKLKVCGKKHVKLSLSSKSPETWGLRGKAFMFQFTSQQSLQLCLDLRARRLQGFLGASRDGPFRFPR